MFPWQKVKQDLFDKICMLLKFKSVILSGQCASHSETEPAGKTRQPGATMYLAVRATCVQCTQWCDNVPRSRRRGAVRPLPVDLVLPGGRGRWGAAPPPVLSHSPPLLSTLANKHNTLIDIFVTHSIPDYGIAFQAGKLTNQLISFIHSSCYQSQTFTNRLKYDCIEFLMNSSIQQYIDNLCSHS